MFKFSLASVFFTFAMAVNAVQLGEILPSCTSVIKNAGDFKGKVILIDFWATWCPPCLKSMPFLNKLRNELKPQGFEVLAINVDEDIKIAQEFLGRYPVDYKVKFDPEGKCPAIYDVKVMPSSYLVDRSGKVSFIHLGFRDKDQTIIRQKITEALAQ